MVGPKLLHAASSRVISAGMILRDEKLASLYESLGHDFPGDKYRALLAQNMTFSSPLRSSRKDGGNFAFSGGRRIVCGQFVEIVRTAQLGRSEKPLSSLGLLLFSPKS